jgi:TetR/AcrR family transcriptional regulator, fatty acid metabolism regulator protein
MIPAETGSTGKPPRRGGIPRAGADGGDKREAVLRAAIRTFARHGFSNTEAADIARAAGVSQRTVSLHFENKDDLLVAVFDRMMGDAIDEGRTALAAISDPIARLDEIARLHLARVGRDRDLAIVCQVELRQSVKFMERFSTTRLREYLGIIRDAIAAGQQRGVFRDGLKPTVAAKLFFGMLDEMATDWVLSPRRHALEAESALVVDLFVNGLTSKPVAAIHAAEEAPRPAAKRRGPRR